MQLCLHFDNTILTIKYKRQNKFIISQKNKDNTFAF